MLGLSYRAFMLDLSCEIYGSICIINFCWTRLIKLFCWTCLIKLFCWTCLIRLACQTCPIKLFYWTFLIESICWTCLRLACWTCLITLLLDLSYRALMLYLSQTCMLDLSHKTFARLILQSLYAGLVGTICLIDFFWTCLRKLSCIACLIVGLFYKNGILVLSNKTILLTYKTFLQNLSHKTLMLAYLCAGLVI